MNPIHRGIEVGEAKIFGKGTGVHVTSISSPGWVFHLIPTPPGVDPIRNEWVVKGSSSWNLVFEYMAWIGGVYDEDLCDSMVGDSWILSDDGVYGVSGWRYYNISNL